MFHLWNDLSKRGPRGTGCGHGQTRESLNEARIRVSCRSALSDQFLVHVIPKDDLSWNVLVWLRCGLIGRSFWLLMICLRRVCQKMVCQFLVREIPKDGRNEKLAYARSLNLNRVSRYKKVCLTSSFFPGGRRLVLRCVAYLSTRALVRGHPIGEHRRSFWCRALRDHLLCDEACDRLRF
jgi:hypothetical protein